MTWIKKISGGYSKYSGRLSFTHSIAQTASSSSPSKHQQCFDPSPCALLKCLFDSYACTATEKHGLDFLYKYTQFIRIWNIKMLCFYTWKNSNQWKQKRKHKQIKLYFIHTWRDVYFHQRGKWINLYCTLFPSLKEKIKNMYIQINDTFPFRSKKYFRFSFVRENHAKGPDKRTQHFNAA